MATLDAQVTAIEDLILHGKPRLKKRGSDQARSLFDSLASQRQSIEAKIAAKATDAPELEGLRASAAQFQACMGRLYPLFRIS